MIEPRILMPLEDWTKQAVMIRVGHYQLASFVDDTAGPDRPWLLLIHGFPTSSWDWSAIWPGLVTHYNVAAIDMLGFGLSDKPRNIAYSLVQQADFQEALLAEIGVSEVHVLAHDYGVSVAQELLARQNEHSLSVKLQSICFLNGGLFPGHHRPRLIQKLSLSPLGPIISARLTRQALHRNFDAIFGPNTKPSDREIAGHWAMITRNGGNKIFHKLMRYMKDRVAHKERWERALHEATIPLALINGGADPISGKHLYDHWCSQLPQASALLLREIGHYPQTEAPEIILQKSLAFYGSSRMA